MHVFPSVKCHRFEMVHPVSYSRCDCNRFVFFLLRRPFYDCRNANETLCFYWPLLYVQVAVYHVHWFFAEPTLTLPNLNALLVQDSVGIGIWMDIPRSKLKMIEQQYSNNIQRNHECGRVYLTEHPSPNWQNIADGLYYEGHIEELQVVQRNYLKGE